MLYGLWSTFFYWKQLFAVFDEALISKPAYQRLDPVQSMNTTIKASFSQVGARQVHNVNGHCDLITVFKLYAARLWGEVFMC